MTEAILRLDSGIVITYDTYMDGGGISARLDFIDILGQLGKKYKNCFEWCAGPAYIGFEILGTGHCENLFLSDTYAPAIDSCIKNAEANNLSDKVFGYVSDNVKDLPFENIDLVVSNPPHNDSMAYWKETFEHLTTSELFAHGARIGVDDGYSIHEEFFANIVDKLSDDADVLLSEAGNTDPFISMAEKYGLKHIKTYNNKHAAYKGYTIHFKLNKER